jgi:hypothetical protein
MSDISPGTNSRQARGKKIMLPEVLRAEMPSPYSMPGIRAADNYGKRSCAACKFFLSYYSPRVGYAWGEGRCQLLAFRLQFLPPSEPEPLARLGANTYASWVCDLFESPEDDEMPPPWNDPWLDIGGEG